MGEVTYVFMDTWATCTDTSCWFHDQLDAVEIYLDRKLKAHPDNLVGVVCYGHKDGLLTGAANHLVAVREAVSAKQALRYTTNLLGGLEYSRQVWHQDMKRRMVLFTGGPLHFPRDQLPQVIRLLKEERVVLDVVDFGPRLNGHDDEYNAKQVLLNDLVDAMNENEDSSRYFLIPDDGFSLSHHIESILPSLSEEEQAPIKRIRHSNGSPSICNNHNTFGDEEEDDDNWFGGWVADPYYGGDWFGEGGELVYSGGLLGRRQGQQGGGGGVEDCCGWVLGGGQGQPGEVVADSGWLSGGPQVIGRD